MEIHGPDNKIFEKTMQIVRIWDLPTRLFHWVLALAVIGLVVTGKVGGNAMAWHFRLGYVVFALLLFRLVWGLVGGHWSRFVAFVYAPATLIAYLRGEGRPEHAAGHSPTGALSVFALLAVLGLQVATGLFSDDEIAAAGPLTTLVTGKTVSLATGWHKQWGQWLVIGLVVLHVAAIVYYRFAKRENLVTAMLTGDKTLEVALTASRDGVADRLKALLVLALAAGVVWWVVSLGGAKP